MTSVEPGDSPTWSVSELHEAVNGLLEYTFGPQVWVQGELRNVSRSANGHVYFDLVDTDAEPGRAPTPMLAVTLFANQKVQVNAYLKRVGSMRMEDGVRVRIRGELGTYSARSTLQLRMDWIDPDHTLGVMERERDRVLALLSGEGLLDVNAEAPVPEFPLHIALVTSVGSAAHADAMHELEYDGLGIRVTIIDTRTQGVDAERSLAKAIEHAAALEVDLTLLVRGGGARTDLAAYDSEAVARAIASSAVPVWTGVGHEIDRTVADEVAHTAFKTPTAAAAAVVGRLRSAEDELDSIAAALPLMVRGRITRAGTAVELIAARSGRAASHRLEREARSVVHLGERIAAAAPRTADRDATALAAVVDRLAPVARLALDVRRAELDRFESVLKANDPVRALARGWTITRDASGAVVKSASGLAAGDTLLTEFTDGSVQSGVLTNTPKNDPTDNADADPDPPS